MFRSSGATQTLYKLSDGQIEYQLKDRWSFMRCVGLALHDPVPDAKTIWLFRDQLARAGVVERLFAWLDALLRAKALAGKGRADRRCKVDRRAGSGLTKAETDSSRVTAPRPNGSRRAGFAAGPAKIEQITAWPDGQISTTPFESEKPA